MQDRSDETQEFLAELYQRAKQDGEDPQDVAERVYQNARGVSRREAMQAGGALGVGALLGGGGGYAATQNAKADPSTSDDDGNVGLPSDRVDVFADGIDSNSINAETSLTERLPTVDVDAFGAVGDGSTDDRQAVDDAINSLGSDEQGILRFSAGNHYYLSDTVTVPADKIRAIDGTGAYLVIDGEYPAISYQGSHNGTANPDDTRGIWNSELGSRIHNLAVYSTGDPSGTYVGTGLEVETVHSLTITDPYATRLRNGIMFVGQSRNVTVTDPNIYDCRDTGLFFNGSNIHQFNLNGGHISYMADPILLDGSHNTNFQLSGADLEVNDNGTQTSPNAVIRSINDAGNYEWSVTGCTIQGHNNVESLIKLGGETRDVSISGNHLSNATNGVMIPQSAVIENTTVKGGAVKGFDYILRAESSSAIPGLSIEGIQARDTNLVWIAGGGRVGPLTISDVSIQPTTLDTSWIYVTGDPLRNITITGVTAYPTNAPSGGAWMMDVDYDSDARVLTITDNQLYTRNGGGSGNGMRVNSSDIDGAHISQNTVREVPGTEFDLPSSSTTNDVENNFGI